MPGDPHEIIIKAIQDDPKTAAWLLDLTDRGHRLETCSDAETRSNSLGSPGLTERRADVVICLSFPDEPDRIVICEVQNKWKNEKYYRLPGYIARAFEDYRTPVELILVCSTDALAARYAKGIEIGPDNIVRVHAVGPAGVADSTKPIPNAAAAVIAAVLRAAPPADEIESYVSTLDHWLGTIEPGLAADYMMCLVPNIAAEVAALLEELMQTKSRPYHSAYSDRLRAEGREEGREEGAVREARRFLVELIEATQGGITPEQRGRIEACDGLHQLHAWMTKFITTRSANGLFDE
jgi:hypothetical protein